MFVQGVLNKLFSFGQLFETPVAHGRGDVDRDIYLSSGNRPGRQEFGIS